MEVEAQREKIQLEISEIRKAGRDRKPREKIRQDKLNSGENEVRRGKGRKREERKVRKNRERKRKGKERKNTQRIRKGRKKKESRNARKKIGDATLANGIP